jgi:RimJ/RimL family protein N-acetyltransferase
VLKGSLVNLRAVEPDDYRLLWQWTNDPDVMVYWGRPGNSQSLPEVARLEELQAARGTSRKYIVETVEALPIGQIDYYDLDWQARSAWTSIMIANQEFWGGGYGTDSMRTLLTYLFMQMGLHRVSLAAHVTNKRAIRSYEKNGFKVEGTLREWAFFNGAWVDGVLMSVLESDFMQLRSEASTPAGSGA